MKSLLLPPLDERFKAWEDAVVAPRWNIGATMDLLMSVLEAQLSRVESSIESLDRKAALVIPAVGALAGLVGTNINRAKLDDPALAWSLALTSLAAALAIVFAVVALGPWWERSSGPQPEDMATRTDGDAGQIAAGIISSMGFAVLTAQQVANRKAFWVTLSLSSGAVAVVLLIFFVGLGGLV